PSVIHGCGLSVDGSWIVKMFTSDARHSGWKNQWAGRSATAAKTTSVNRTRFAVAPSENRGGRSRRENPRTAITTPSSHFQVPPARKQAITGSNATIALAIQPVVVRFCVSRDLDPCTEFDIIQSKLSSYESGLKFDNQPARKQNKIAEGQYHFIKVFVRPT